MSQSASSSSSAMNIKHIHAQLETINDNKANVIGCLRTAIQQYHKFRSLIHLPKVRLKPNGDPQRPDDFLEQLLGVVLNNELRFAKKEEYTGEITSLEFLTGDDHSPVLEIAVLEVQPEDDESINEKSACRTYRVSLDKDWNITKVAVKHQALLRDDFTLQQEEREPTASHAPLSAKIYTDRQYYGLDSQHQLEFDDDAIENLLDDFEFAKKEDNIDAAFRFYQLDRNKLREKLQPIRAELKKVNEKSQGQQLPLQLKQEIKTLNDLLQAQEKLCRAYEVDMGATHASLQTETTYNTVIAEALIQVTRGLHAEMNKRIKERLEVPAEEKFGVEELMSHVVSMEGSLRDDYIAGCKKHYKDFKQRVHTELERLQHAHSGSGQDKKLAKLIEQSVDEVSMDLLENAKQIIEKLGGNSKETDLRNMNTFMEDLSAMETKSQNSLVNLQEELAWAPHVRIDNTKIHEQDFLQELEKASAALKMLFSSYRTTSQLVSRGSSQLTNSNVDDLLAACNLVMSEPNISPDFKGRVKAEFQKEPLVTYIRFLENQNKFIFLKEKRSEDVQANYARNLPDVEALLEGLEHIHAQVVSTSAQVDYAKTDQAHDEQLASVLVTLPQGSQLGQLFQQYQISHDATRKIGQEISAHLFNIKMSPELTKRLTPIVEVLEQHVKPIVASQLNTNIKKIVDELNAYHELEKKYANDSKQVAALNAAINHVLTGLRQKISALQSSGAYPKLDYQFALDQLAGLLKKQDINEKVKGINVIIKHDYKTLSNDTISFKVREWLPGLLGQYPALNELSVSKEKKKIVYTPGEDVKKAEQNCQELDRIATSLCQSLMAQTATYAEHRKNWEDKKQSIEQQIQQTTQALKEIDEIRQAMKKVVGDVSQTQHDFTINYNNDLALYQGLLQPEFFDEVDGKISANSKEIITHISDMQVLQEQLDSTAVLIERAREIQQEINQLQQLAMAKSQELHAHREKLFKKEMIQLRNSQHSLQQNLFSLIRTVVIDGLSYWNNKGNAKVNYNGQDYWVPTFISELLNNILTLEQRSERSGISPTEDDIKQMLRINFMLDALSGEAKTIAQTLLSIANTSLQDIKEVKRLNEQLSRDLEIVFDVPAKPASLEELYQLVKDILAEDASWKQQKMGHKKLPHRVEQMTGALSKTGNDLPIEEKWQKLLGKEDKNPGYFAEPSTFDPSRKEVTTDFYAVMTIMHDNDSPTEAVVKSLMVQLKALKAQIAPPPPVDPNLPAAEASLQKLYQLIQDILGQESFWKGKKLFGKKFPHRVEQMRDAKKGIQPDMPVMEKLRIVLGKKEQGSGLGFFATPSKFDLSRKEETTDFYDVMTNMHLNDFSKEAAVQSFIVKLEKLQAKIMLQVSASSSSMSHRRK